jgi:hypothetical protein
MSDSELVEQMNSVSYLYLRELSEPRDNSLRLVVEEAVSNQLGDVNFQQLPELESIFKDAHPIESTPGCKKFELYWKRYVAYLVTEESVGSNAANECEDESFTGRLMRLYTVSHFLDHLKRDTGGHFQDVQHYKVICLNHLIDIAAYSPPEIRVVASPMSGRTQ